MHVLFTTIAMISKGLPARDWDWPILKAREWEILPADRIGHPDNPCRVGRPNVFGTDEANNGFIIRAESPKAANFPDCAIGAFGLRWYKGNKVPLKSQVFRILKNWSVQRAPGFPKDSPAPSMLCGIDAATGDFLAFDSQYFIEVQGRNITYSGPTMPSEKHPNIQETVHIELSEIDPRYEKHIRRWCIETWDPNNPIRLEKK
jgi:hypothetical protein